MTKDYRYFSSMSFFCLAFICSLNFFFLVETEASTQLDGVALESGSSSQYRYSESSGYWSEPIGGFVPCGTKDIWVWLAETDTVTEDQDTLTINKTGLYNKCTTFQGNYNYRLWDGSGLTCKLCTDSSSENYGPYCSQGQTNQITFIIGASTISGQGECSDSCEESYASCNLEPPSPAGKYYVFRKTDSSYSFRLECPDQRIVNFLEILADVWIEQDGQQLQGILMLNGMNPVSNSSYNYKWDIPINKKCGDIINVTPSISGGLATASVNSIRAILCTVDITGFSSTDTTFDPSAGESVKMTASITSDSAVNWTLTVADRTFRGSGNTVSVAWDGKDSSGKIVPEGIYTATLAAVTVDGNCKDIKDLQIKVEANLNLVAGTGDSPTDAGTEITLADGVTDMRFPLGSVFFIQLVKKDNDGKLIPVESSFTLETATVNPSIAEETLFPNNVVIELDHSHASGIKFFEAVHLGEVILNIAPDDSAMSPIEARIIINEPLALGSTNNDIDETLIDLGHRRGIPPQMLKGQVRQESNFKPKAYRYEPLSVDMNYISRGQNLRTTFPYSLYRLTTSDGLAQGTDILTEDISPRSIYSIIRNKVLRSIDDADQFVSAYEIYQLNDGVNHWSRYSSKRAKAVETNPNILKFTAQTPIASSYGYLQILYATALNPMQWAGINGAHNPSYLFDNDNNIAAGGGSLALGSGYLRIVFPEADPEISLTDPEFDDKASFATAYEWAFNYYNHGDTDGDYGTSVLKKSRRYTPIESTSIFP